MGTADSSPGSLVAAQSGTRLTYFATASSPAVIQAMSDGLLGVMITYTHGLLPEGAQWAMDNGVFGNRYPYPGDDIYLKRISAFSPENCWFVTAPDVVCDAQGTLERSLPMLPRIRAAGFPVAFVAQDGAEDMDLPWDEFDVLFLGGGSLGGNEWKEGPGAERLSREAVSRGKRVHMGRVNTLRRMRIAKDFGCATADGTILRFGPDKNLPILLGFLRQVNKVNCARCGGTGEEPGSYPGS